MAISAVVGSTLFVLRKREERRIANLQACLFGEPLAKGELASKRYQAIELARPWQKLTTKWETGMKSRLVPENPIPPEKRWPNRCSTHARAATSLAWLVGSGLKDDLVDLADALNEGKEPTVLDTIFREGRFRGMAAPDVERPWAPVVFAATVANADVEPACPAHTMLATLDHWDDDLFVLGGKSGCTIESADGKRLARLRRSQPADKMKNDDALEGGSAARIAGRSFVLEEKVASWDGEVLDDATRFTTCASNGTRAILLENDDKHSAHVRFVDADGRSGGGSFVFSEPDFSDRGRFSLTMGPRTMSCRGKEARVAWAWSTAVDQRATHKIMVATCTKDRCTTDSVRVHIDTPHWQNCGYCDADPNEGTIESPIVVDLFDALAVLWHDRTTVRARVAPAGKIEDSPDLVLWHHRDGGWFEQPRIINRGNVALVGVRLTLDKLPAQSRLFRVEAAASDFNVSGLGL